MFVVVRTKRRERKVGAGVVLATAAALWCACGAEGIEHSSRTQADGVLGGRYSGHPNTVMLAFWCTAEEVESSDDTASADDQRWVPCEGIPTRAAVVLGSDSPYVLTHHDPETWLRDMNRLRAIDLHFTWTTGRAPPVARVLAETVLIEVGPPDGSDRSRSLAVFRFAVPVRDLPLRQGDATAVFTSVSLAKISADTVKPDGRPTNRLAGLVLGPRAETSRLRADGIVVMQHLSFAEERGHGAIQAQVAFDLASGTQSRGEGDRLRAFYEVDERSLRCSGPVRGHGVLEPGDVGGPVYELDPTTGGMTLYAITSRAELVYGRALSGDVSSHETGTVARHRAAYERMRQHWPEFHAYLTQSARTEGHRLKLYGGVEAIRVDEQSSEGAWLRGVVRRGL